ncbi:MAG: LacI family DNA-binding transcriptional regulator, partial [Firmicutes bacterium]|nr:LacI family DNA-binding transcriptional regulator [Bacillota bacterium]
MAITIKEIASIAGVSRGTVDKVIHNRPGLRKETYERVKKVLEELNYTPDPLAKALVEKHNPYKIGVILTPDYNPFIQDMLKGIERAKKEFQFFGLDTELYLSQSLEVQEQIDALEHFRQSGARGIALFPINDTRVAAKANELISSGIPIMTFNSRNTDINDICFLGQDHYKAGKIAAGLMNRELRGGGRVGVIISTMMLSCHTERLKGFQDQLAEYDSPISIIDVQENLDRADLSAEIASSFFERCPELDGIYITGVAKVGLMPAHRSKPV